MKRFGLLILFAFFFSFSIEAQYANINIDNKTIAAMSAAFATEAKMEARHNENLLKILESYKAAEVATAGIFAVKYLDRKALTNLDLWSSDENYYYKRIYNLVGTRIIPKTIDVAKLMVKDPSTAIYWGSYLVKTTEDVKSLCQQFESVVTNSTLSFKDLPFLEIAEQFKEIFNITKLGDVDWKVTFEQIGSDIANSFTKENFKKDLEQLVSKGVGLAGSGFNSSLEELLKGTSFGGSFQKKIGSLITLADNANSMYKDIKDKSALEIANSFIDGNNISSLFQPGDYNLTHWMDDFSSSSKEQFYTQRVYIYRQEKKTEQLCNYYPPEKPFDILRGSHWIRFAPNTPLFTPSTIQKEQILSNSESHAGWSRQKVAQLNQQNAGTGYSYEINYSLHHKTCKDAFKKDIEAYAYDIQIYKHTNITEIVYEEVFDSYKMDWNAFMKLMNTRLEQYNLNGDHTEVNSPNDLTNHPEKNYTYHIGYGDRNYYETTTEEDFKGASSATFNVTCHGNGTLGKGSSTYKCRGCGKTLTEHTKQCSMLTSIPEDNSTEASIKELEKKLQAYQLESASIQSDLDDLNKENNELRRKMSSATSTEEYESYRKQFEANQAVINEKQAHLNEINQSIADTNQAISDAENGENQPTDDTNRIPNLMRTMKNAYDISWSEQGSWNGFQFVRRGTIGGNSSIGNVTFTATLSINRKPKYFMGIKIHRTIIQIDWELTSSWSESTVAEEIELDPSLSDAKKSEIVNNKLSEIAQQHPNCEVTVDLYNSPAQNVEDKEGVKHLLWASDRLEIAKDINARLIIIYTDLVYIEKFMHYKYGIKDWLQRFIPKLNADKDRKFNIAEQCHKRWMDIAKKQESRNPIQ